MHRILRHVVSRFWGKRSVCRRIPQKYVVCLLMAFNIMHWRALSLTCYLSLKHLVTIVYEKGHVMANLTNITQEILHTPVLVNEKLCREEIPMRGPFTESRMEIKNLALSDDLYFYVLIVTHVPIGWTCDKYGVRNIVLVSSVLGTLLASSFPSVINNTAMLFTLHKLLQSVIETIVILATIHLVSRWTLKEEYIIDLTLCYTGFALGDMYTLLLMRSLLMISWQMMFYIIACTYFVVLLLNLYFIYNNPIVSPFASEQEKAKIVAEISEDYPERLPWKAIFLDSTVWAILAGQSATMLVRHFSQLHSYNFMITIIGIDVFKHYYTLIICLVACVCVPLFFSFGAQYCVNKKMVPILYLRTFSAAMGNIVPFLFILLTTYTGCLSTSIFICHTLGAAVRDIGMIGTKGNILDITRYYCAVIDGLVHGWGRAIVGLTVPKMAYVFRMTTVDEFRLSICAIGSISTFLTVLYYVWTDSRRSDWDTLEMQRDLSDLKLKRQKERSAKKCQKCLVAMQE